MNSFLITFKPDTENPDRGWPLAELQKLVRRRQAGERVIEPWRFHNRKDVSIGDRVFVLLQGKRGPAIIGYGQVAGRPEKIDGNWQAAVQLESLVDPTTEEFASKEDLLAIEGGRKVWGTQASGVHLKELIADHLEALVVGNPPKPRTKSVLAVAVKADDIMATIPFEVGKTYDRQTDIHAPCKDRNKAVFQRRKGFPLSFCSRVTREISTGTRMPGPPTVCSSSPVKGNLET